MRSQGPEHPRMLGAVHALGLGLLGCGGFDGAAEQLRHRVLEPRHPVLGAGQFETLWSQPNTAIIQELEAA